MMILNDVNVKNTCEYVYSLLSIVLKCIFQSQSFLSILIGLWWCNANPQWFTTYLSVWTGRWSAWCLDLCWCCRGAEFLFLCVVSRLGLWSRVVLARWIPIWLCSFGVETLLCWDLRYDCIRDWRMLFLYVISEIYNCYGLYMCSAAMWCNMIFMHVCFNLEDVASISRIYLYIRVFYRLIEVGCYKLVSEPWSVLSGLMD
jgi:hypothetical protein